MKFNLITNAKNGIFLLIFCLLSFQTFAISQNNVRITLNSNKITVIDALREIEKQSKLSIAFNESQLADKNATNLNVKNMLVEEALTVILQDSGFTYRMTNGYIVIVPVSEYETPLKWISGKVLDENKDPLIGVTISVEGEPTRGTATDINGI